MTVKALEGVSVTLDSTRLSDLFFNHQHDHFDVLMQSGDKEATDADDFEQARKQAIKEDAAEFASLLLGSRPDSSEAQALAEQLAEDFLDRL